MGTPQQCQGLEAQVSDLESQIQDINGNLLQGPDDPHPGKPDLQAEAEKKALVKLLASVKGQFDACMIAAGNKPDLNATFAGSLPTAGATLTINDPNPQIKGPFKRTVSIGLMFNKWDHTTLEVTNFPDIVVGPFPIPGGSDTIDVSMKGVASGNFDPASGALNLTIPLYFAHSAGLVANSDITFNLSTANPGGSPLNGAGSITVSGTSTFQNGWLSSRQATLVVVGTIAPLP